MSDTFEVNKQISAKLGIEGTPTNTYEAVRAQVDKLGGDLTKVNDIYTGELQVLEHIGGGAELEELNATANGTYIAEEGKGYSPVNVNVPQEVTDPFGFDTIGYTPVNCPEMKAGVEYAKQIGDNWVPDATTSLYNKYHNDMKLLYFPEVDGSHITDMTYTFSECCAMQYFKMKNITAIESLNHTFANCSSLLSAPEMDTQNVTNFDGTFEGCKSIQTIPDYNLKKVTSASYTFNESGVTTIQDLDLPELTNTDSMFSNTRSLVTVGNLNTPKLSNVYAMFYGSNVQTIGTIDCSSVTDDDLWFAGSGHITNLSGFTNLGKSFTDHGNCPLQDTSMLTNESVENVINSLWDMTNNEYNYSPALELNRAVTITDEQKTKLTNKGWTLTQN